VWTSDITNAHKVARDLEAGVVWVNCYDLGDMTQPCGGFKQSGIRRDKCLDTLNAVSESKSVWINLDKLWRWNDKFFVEDE
jgi:gamma-glutamyl-gamma-aminobutyraldehyde dehydrogenase